MQKSRRSSKPKAPNGDEKKNQLDLFFDWAQRTAVAAAAAVKDATTKSLEDLCAAFDKRALTICGAQVPLLAACAYRATSFFTVVVVVAAAISTLLVLVPWLIKRIPSHADWATRSANFLGTVLLMVSVIATGADIAIPWLSSFTDVPPTQQADVPKTEPRPAVEITDEKVLTEEAQREAAAQAEKEAARLADCLSKENAITAARKIFRWRERKFVKCKTEHSTAFTIKSLDGYCGEKRGKLDAAARALDAAVANMCSSTGSTKKK